jgi:tetratricopeptide (TPR) repeat protein
VKVTEFLVARFTDHSQRLTRALERANAHAWKAFEIALGGRSLLDRCKLGRARAEDLALAEQIQGFLAASPLTQASGEQKSFFQQALKELRAARSSGVLTIGQLAVAELARAAGDFARFTDPLAEVDAEWQWIERTAAELRANCPNLARIVVTRTSPGRSPSLLADAARYYFRREVETDKELFQGLAFAKLEKLQETQERAFAELSTALSRQGQWLEELLVGLDEKVERLEERILRKLEQLQLHGREVRPSDSLALLSEDERALVKQLVAAYRSLPADQRQQMPALLDRIGKLEIAAGEFESAQRDFQAAARLTESAKDRAERHHNAYRAALERQQWAEALVDFQQAVELDPQRFAVFPMARFDPQRILGAGGFGVVFLCQDRHLGRPVVLKSLQASDLDRDIKSLFAEAKALYDLQHPDIIRLLECGHGGGAATHPYLLMDYFDGINLETYVREQGLLSPEELLPLSQSMIAAMQAAHARGILHRDVKPANLLVRRDGDGWRMKLIDFGLALRPGTVEGKGSTQGPKAGTILGRSIAGTLLYAAPEQLGRLPGTAVGPHSDVYGFGRTCYYALLGTPEPDDREKDGLPEGWRRLLSGCTGRWLGNRFPDFWAVADQLAAIGRRVVPATIPSALLALPARQPRRGHLLLVRRRRPAGGRRAAAVDPAPRV